MYKLKRMETGKQKGNELTPVYLKIAVKVMCVCVWLCGAVLTYRVEVYTGYVLNAGTDANVHLMLIGERGDTGYRQLLKPLSAAMSGPFQPGQVNTTFCKHASVNMNLASVVVMRHSLFYLTESRKVSTLILI